MRGIFNVDGPVIGFIIKIFDCMCLSVLWFLCSLPIITAGASSTALYHTIYHYIRNGEGTLLRTFFGAFWENWKRSTLLWLVVLLMGVLLIADVLVFRTLAIQGSDLGKLYSVVLILCALLLTWSTYLVAYAARFQGTVKEVLRVSFLLVIVHPIRAIGVFAILAIGILLSIMNTGFLTITPAGVFWGCSFLIEGAFAKHMQQ